MPIFNPGIKPIHGLWAPIPVVTDIGDPGDVCSSLSSISCRRILKAWIIKWMRKIEIKTEIGMVIGNKPKRTALISDRNGLPRQQMQKAVRLTMFSLSRWCWWQRYYSSKNLVIQHQPNMKGLIPYHIDDMRTLLCHKILKFLSFPVFFWNIRT